MSNYQWLLDSAEKQVLKILKTHVELPSAWLWWYLKEICYKRSNTILISFQKNDVQPNHPNSCHQLSQLGIFKISWGKKFLFEETFAIKQPPKCQIL